MQFLEKLGVNNCVNNHTCTTINRDILRNIASITTSTNSSVTFLNKYLQILNNKGCLYSSTDWVPVVQELCKTTVPDNESFKILISEYYKAKPILDQLINDNISINPVILLYIVNANVNSISVSFANNIKPEYPDQYSKVIESACSKGFMYTGVANILIKKKVT